jgi:phosphate transport system substrate-binding protein
MPQTSGDGADEMIDSRRILIAVTVGVTGLGLLAAASHSNRITGSIKGQISGQTAIALAKIEVQVESGGNEKASIQSDQAGVFAFNLDTSNHVFRLVVWDSGNRWWGRDISHIPNDVAHPNLPAIVLRPQTSNLSPDETREQHGVISWLRKHNPLSAALMELHLGAFDVPGQPTRATIAGAGSPGSYPVYVASAAAYQREHPDVAINYQAIGSGSGIRQITSGTTDFGTTERRFTTSELGTARHPIDQVPIGLSATVVIYNVRRLPSNLRFSGPVLSKIFLGQVKSWNDPELKRINPDSDLPEIPIIVVSRADGSSSTDTLSRYLGAGSPEWKNRIGIGTSLQWPTGKSAKGDEGVAGQVGETDGAIGYVDFRGADRPSVQAALLQNLDNRFIAASATSISAGYRETYQLADLQDTSVSSKDPGAYPMASVQWMLLSLPGNDPKKELFLLDFARFSMTNDGASERERGMVPLPPQLLSTAEEALNRAAAQILQKADVQQRRSQ